MSVNLVEPGLLYTDRVNQVDLRISKIFRFGANGRLNAGFDLFNMFNSSAVVAQNNSYSPTTTTWQQPQSIIPGRLVKFSVVFDF